MLSGFPTGEVSVPDEISRAGEGRSITPVWLNGLGGLTFQLGRGPSRRFAKWAPAGSALDLRGEAERCRWAAAYAAVPRVVEFGEGPSGSWLVTEGLPGENAVTAGWKRQPRRAVVAIGRGLRHLHDTLPVAECPFEWSVPTRLAQASAEGIEVARFPMPPPVDQNVVCHGDACAPNTLIDDTGQCSGHVDLGSLGVADRWADLAVAAMSLGWNYGAGWDETFLDAYGIEPDRDRLAYYRDLWNLGDEPAETTPAPHA
jgi:kanamycin kinase